MRYRLAKHLLPVKEKDKLMEEDIGIEVYSSHEFKDNQVVLPHKRELLRLLDRVRYCRIETFGSSIVGTLIILEADRLSVKRREFGFCFSKKRLIFVDDSGFVKSILSRFKETQFEEDVTAAVFFADFLNRIIEDDSGYLQDYENTLIELETQMLERGKGIHREQNRFGGLIIQYRKDMLRLHSYFSQLEDFGNVLQANVSHIFSGDELNLFAAFSHHVGCLSGHTQMLRDYIVQIYDMYQSQLDLMQTHNMNLLTVVTTIFLPLSLLAGWYGMNFSHMPELMWQHGYFWVIGLSAVILVGEIYIFRKKHLL